MSPSDLSAALSHGLLTPTFKLHWVYLLSALCVAVLVYFFRRSEYPDTPLRQFLFPGSVWLHRSAITDCLFVVATMPVWVFVVSPHLLSYERISRLIAGVGSGLAAWQRTSEPGAAATVCYTLVLLLAVDLTQYWLHRWMHRSALLWEFHKVHHSAEVLTPATVYRVHPVERLLQQLATAVVIGAVTGVFLWVAPSDLTPIAVLGVNAGRSVFYFLGANLRHSHIWLSYGRTLGRIFISPAQHQIHHSNDPRHFDRNFGFEFALWDWIFGSLYLTDPRREVLRLGLGEKENSRLSSLDELLVTPFVAAGKMLLGGKRQPA